MMRKVKTDLLPNQVNRELQAALAQAFSPDELMAYFDSLLGAKTTSGHPEHRTRLAALTLLLSYQIGRPVERSENITVQVDASSLADMEERLSKSPAMRQAFRRVLESAEARGGDAVEAETVSESQV